VSSPDFQRVIRAFARDSRVAVGDGKGFGSGGLKVDGRLFALISSRGQFVAKLPKQRVRELVAQGKGEPFDPGHGRLMREWVALDEGGGLDWVKLAREARRFVGGDS
jgi:hypothetical protein